MSTERTERIRQRAYELWETQGRPEGRDLEHWEQARLEIEAEGSSDDGTAAENTGLAPQEDDLSAEFTARLPDARPSLDGKPGDVAGDAPIATRSSRGKKSPRV